jgi:hypothetical protein
MARNSAPDADFENRLALMGGFGRASAAGVSAPDRRYDLGLVRLTFATTRASIAAVIAGAIG